MTKEEIIEQIFTNHTEDEVLEAIDEAKYDFINDDDIEEYGDICDAYEQIGGGEAEDKVLQNILKSYDINPKDDTDLYCEVYDVLCEEWGISSRL